MVFEVTILGSGSALPTLNRNTSGQAINLLERYFLVDCGEGTQLQLRKSKFKFQRIQSIFISHLHGDHYLGLMGLLSSFHLLGRKSSLKIFAPKGLKEIIDLQLTISKTYLGYELDFNELSGSVSQKIFEDNLIEVWTLPLVHRVYCNGFLFKEKPRKRSINKEQVDRHSIPMSAYLALKEGEDYISPSGEIIKNEKLTLNPPKERSYAYCSDTRYSEALVPSLKGISMLYHEATFLNKHLERAKSTYHSTALQAGRMAKICEVTRLLIGHFSARYKNETELLEEARLEFPNVISVNDGDVFRIV